MKNTEVDKLAKHIESLIFVAEEAISIADLKYNLDSHFNTKFKIVELEDMVSKLIDKYSSDDHAIEIIAIANGYKFMTKPAYHNTIGTYLKNNTKRKLSRSAMEVLSIIAYKQPVAKSEIEFIRGVNCDYSVQKLLEKDLLEIKGRDPGPGRPLLYGTSDKFMDYFGLKSMDDLPKPKEFKIADTEAGEGAAIDEIVISSVSQEE